ncbi:MAG: sugar-phosphate kinase, partial [Tetragenococcus halophilus]|nr:sugar-phosphate kinase [Tetragenococcus halophilus]
MEKLPIKTVVEGLLKLQKTGESATILGVGPMSRNCVQATLELSQEDDFPVMFIASRNQVDADELGGGYVNGWNQFTFAKAVEEVAEKINYDNLYYLCR